MSRRFIFFEIYDLDFFTDKPVKIPDAAMCAIVCQMPPHKGFFRVRIGGLWIQEWFESIRQKPKSQKNKIAGCNFCECSAKRNRFAIINETGADERD
ncbi:MAG: hypothetical protein WA081_07220 [Desulfosalsimonadaceae bacterium]